MVTSITTASWLDTRLPHIVSSIGYGRLLASACDADQYSCADPNVSQEAKQHAEQVLRENDAY